MRYIFKFLIALICISCGAADLKVEDDSSVLTIDSRPWHTWTECGYNIGDNVCNFTLQDQDGKDFELYDHYGKIIIVDLSTMWCGVCQSIAGYGEIFMSEYGSDNIIWVTILVEDEYGNPTDQSDLIKWIDVYGSHKPVLAGDRSLVDPIAEEGYPVTGWPTFAIVDQEMKIAHGINGWSESSMRMWIASLL